MNYFLIAQSIGIIAMFLTVIRMVFKERNTLLIVGSASFFAWAIHCAMLNAWTCAAFNIVGCITSLIALAVVNDNQFIKIIYWGLSILACIFTLYISVEWFEYLPMIAFICITIANYCAQTIWMRLWTLGAEPSWLFYNIEINSWGGMLTSVFKVGTIFWGIWRHEKEVITKCLSIE